MKLIIIRISFHVLIERNNVPYEIFLIGNGPLTIYLTGGQTAVNCSKSFVKVIEKKWNETRVGGVFLVCNS